jgi:hypothetical protein
VGNIDILKKMRSKSKVAVCQMYVFFEQKLKCPMQPGQGMYQASIFLLKSQVFKTQKPK